MKRVMKKKKSKNITVSSVSFIMPIISIIPAVSYEEQNVNNINKWKKTYW